MPRVCPECGRKFDSSIERCPADGYATFLVDAELDMVGREIDGRYLITKLIGVGGMGAVYCARQLSMDRDVAIKLLRRDLATDEEAIKRFFREAKAASKLTNPHTITVFDFGQTNDGQLFIVMELLHGRPLSSVIQDSKSPMKPERAVSIIVQVLDSLEEAHSVGIIHRDLKPENIFLLEGKGALDFVKVLDFGIAKIQGEGGTQITSVGHQIGTPAYMSPEQIQGTVIDYRSDLYAIGTILFELLTGRLPFDGPTPLALMMNKIQLDAPKLIEIDPTVPVGLSEVVSKLLARNVEDRNLSVPEVRQILLDSIKYKGEPAKKKDGITQEVFTSTSPNQVKPSPEDKVQPKGIRWGVKTIGLTTIVGVTLGLAAVFIFRGNGDKGALVGGINEMENSPDVADQKIEEVWDVASDSGWHVEEIKGGEEVQGEIKESVGRINDKHMNLKGKAKVEKISHVKPKSSSQSGGGHIDNDILKKLKTSTGKKKDDEIERFLKSR